MFFIFDWPLLIQLAIFISLFGLLGIFIVMIIICLKRLKLAFFKNEEKKALNAILKELYTHILVYNAIDEIPPKELLHTICNLNKLKNASLLSRKVLLKTLVHFSINLTDTTNQLLNSTYQLLELRNVSLKKLNSRHWYKRIEGLNELQKMNDSAAIPQIKQLTSDSQIAVRVAAYVALIKLNERSVFSLLMKEKAELSQWHQIILLDAISGLNTAAVPEFEWYLDARQKTIILLGIKAIIHFKEFKAVPRMMIMLNHQDAQIKNQLVNALGILNAAIAERKLKMMYPCENDKNKLQILLALGDIASGNSLDFLVKEFLNAKQFQLLKAAMHAINAHAEDLKNRTIHHLLNLSDSQKMVVRHYNQPLNLHGAY
jgi:hypothetical protein